MVLWDWLDFGISFNICRLAHHSDYHIGIDFQVAWFDLWIQLWKKKDPYESGALNFDDIIGDPDPDKRSLTPEERQELVIYRVNRWWNEKSVEEREELRRKAREVEERLKKGDFR